MKFTRRQLTKLGLISLGGVGALTVTGSENVQAKKLPQQGLKILVLGGTGFLGPHIVRHAMSQGHTVTLFNRGKTGPRQLPDVETLIGNRNNNLKALQNRKWDIVIDTSASIPQWVAASTKLLKPNVGHYIYISSTSVYKDWSLPDMDESSPIYAIDGPDVADFTPFERYGANKVACENEVRKLFPEQNTIIRSDTLVGPGDRQHFRYTSWIKRAAENDELLAPGRKDAYVQYVDARDLGQWIVHCLEKSVHGTFTATSPGSSYTMENMIDDCLKASQSSPQVVWVDSEFLLSRDIFDIPFWVPDPAGHGGVGRFNTSKAQQNGFKSRPRIDTARDVYKWYSHLSEKRQDFKVGLSKSQEQQLIADWKKHSA